MPKDVDHEARYQTIIREKPHQCDSDSPVGILMGPGRRGVRFPAVVRDASDVYDYRTVADTLTGIPSTPLTVLSQHRRTLPACTVKSQWQGLSAGANTRKESPYSSITD